MNAFGERIYLLLLLVLSKANQQFHDYSSRLEH